MRFSVACLPFAGSGASFYRPWQKLAGEKMRVVPLQLPGRQERFADEPFTEVTDVRSLAPELMRQAGPGPVVLFGHSLGAVLAFELARELERLDFDQLEHLVASGSPGPWHGRPQRATGLDDDAFLARVREFAGYDHEVFDNPEMRELLIPLLRADVAMHEDYKPAADPLLSIPVTAVRGIDDTLVSPAQAAQWRETTTGPFFAENVPGGHMYLSDDPRLVLATIEHCVARAH